MYFRRQRPGGAASRQGAAGALNRFLDGLPQRERVLFVSRYWYLRSVKQMAEETGLSESSVKTQLFRTREKLRRFLDKEGLL